MNKKRKWDAELVPHAVHTMQHGSNDVWWPLVRVTMEPSYTYACAVIIQTIDSYQTHSYDHIYTHALKWWLTTCRALTHSLTHPPTHALTIADSEYEWVAAVVNLHIAVVSIAREKHQPSGGGYAEATDGPGIYADIIPQHLQAPRVGPEQSAHVTFAE